MVFININPDPVALQRHCPMSLLSHWHIIGSVVSSKAGAEADTREDI